MNENEKTMIRGMAARLDEVRRLAGFLFTGTEEEVLAALQVECPAICTMQDFGYMSTALTKLADDSATAQLPGTGELMAETLKNRLASNPNGGRS